MIKKIWTYHLLHLLKYCLFLTVTLYRQTSFRCWVTGLFRRVFVCLENTLLDQLLGFGSVLHFLLEAVGAHMFLKLFLLSLDSWRSIGVGKNVALAMISPNGILTWVGGAYAQSTLPFLAASPSLSSSCRLPVGVPVPEQLIEAHWILLSAFRRSPQQPLQTYGAALVSSKMCLSFRSLGSGLI